MKKMSSSITPDPDLIKLAIDCFLKESQPYYDALAKIAILKPQKYILNARKRNYYNSSIGRYANRN